MEEFRLFAGAAVIRDGRILILRRAPDQRHFPGRWGLPCGKVNFGEDVEAAAARELREETGLIGEPVALCGHSAFITSNGRLQQHNVQLTFLFRVDGQDVTISSEHDRFEWHPLTTVHSVVDDYNAEVVRQVITRWQEVR